MVQDPSHVKQLYPIHVCKIGLKREIKLLFLGRGGGGGLWYCLTSCNLTSPALVFMYTKCKSVRGGAVRK
jgi:hypothetical protein